MEVMNETFAHEIEELCWMKDIPYIDAVCLWCEQNSYEVESAALLIKKDPVLRAKIRSEAEISNLLKTKRGSSLPV
jgi:hypothetical protein